MNYGLIHSLVAWIFMENKGIPTDPGQTWGLLDLL